jgi:DNA-binding NarL/FixJ family response regulator
MSERAIRLLLVDDQALFREALRLLLATQPDLAVVGEAANGEEALRLAGELGPDVVLMDLRMPVLDGVAATRRLRAERPTPQVIVLTTFDDDVDVFEALRAGAIGYLLKDVSGDRLFEAIRAAARGESFLQPAIATKLVAEFARLSGLRSAPPATLPNPLSERELEVLKLLATGATNREIGAQLYIAEGTVKNHLTNIMAKLDARDRSQAALKARDLGLI